MNNELKGKTVLVTGGTGSIGSELVDQLLNFEVNRVIIFSRDEIKQFLIKRRILDDRLETYIGDVRDYPSLQCVFTDFDVDIVYHASAMKHVVICENFPMEAVKTNLLGTQNVIDLATKYGVPKLIAISTDKSAYPMNVMGATKFIAERIALNAGYSCVRFGNVANSRGSVIPVIMDNLLNKRSICITNPNATRFMMEIPQAIELILKATKYAKGNDIFILKMRAFRLGDLLEVILDKIVPLLNISSKEVQVNMTGLITGEKLHEDLINHTETNRLYELRDMYVIIENHSKISEYPNIHKKRLTKYTSCSAELITKSDLEKIVINYLGKYRLGAI